MLCLLKCLTCRSANERERQEADAEHRLSRVRAPGPEQKLKEAVIEVTADLEEHNKILQRPGHGLFDGQQPHPL